MTTPRVLFFTHSYPRSASDGAGSFIHRLAVALRPDGTDVHVLAPAGPGLATLEVIDGVPIRRFRYAPSGLETLAYTGTMAEQVRGSLRGKLALAGLIGAGSSALSREIRRLAPDVVHAHWWFPSGAIALLSAARVPLVTTLHGSDVRLARGAALAHPLFRAVLRRSARVTAVSEWLASEARAMAPGADVSVAPMPVDVELFDAAGGTADAGRFLFVGRLNAQKGVADLLEALALLPAESALDVIGTGEDAVPLRLLAEARGIASRIHWLGQVPRSTLPTVYRSARAVIIPSRDEGLGLVAVEAQLCGAPVIAYQSGGLPDVVDPRWGGTLVPAGDIRGLATAMRAALARPRASSRTDAARSGMLDRFSPRPVAAGYGAIYASAIRHGH